MGRRNSRGEVNFISLPIRGAFFEPRVLQQIADLLGVEDTRYRVKNDYKSHKDCHLGTFQFVKRFLGRWVYINELG